MWTFSSTGAVTLDRPRAVVDPSTIRPRPSHPVTSAARRSDPRHAGPHDVRGDRREQDVVDDDEKHSWLRAGSMMKVARAGPVGSPREPRRSAQPRQAYGRRDCFRGRRKCLGRTPSRAIQLRIARIATDVLERMTPSLSPTKRGPSGIRTVTSRVRTSIIRRVLCRGRHDRARGGRPRPRRVEDAHHNYIGNEHCLLGLIHEGEGVRRSDREVDISIEAVRRESSRSSGRVRPPPRVTSVHAAREEVRELSPRGPPARHNYIGTEHILLGIISTVRRRRSGVAEVGAT